MRILPVITLILIISIAASGQNQLLLGKYNEKENSVSLVNEDLLLKQFSETKQKGVIVSKPVPILLENRKEVALVWVVSVGDVRSNIGLIVDLNKDGDLYLDNGQEIKVKLTCRGECTNCKLDESALNSKTFYMACLCMSGDGGCELYVEFDIGLRF